MRYLVTIAFSLLLIFFTEELSGQGKNNSTWHSGEVVIQNTDTLRGLIKYSFKENQVFFKTDKEQRILLPGKFTSVTFRDSYDSTIHNFLVYDIKTARDYNRPYFFEPVDTLGRIKLVKQFYWIERSTNFGGSAYFADVRSVKYTALYYYRREKTVKLLSLKKRDVLRVLKDKKHQIKQFVEENNLRYNTTRSVKKIIKHYNSLPV